MLAARKRVDCIAIVFPPPVRVEVEWRVGEVVLEAVDLKRGRRDEEKQQHQQASSCSFPNSC
jgi:hypothetical protein